MFALIVTVEITHIVLDILQLHMINLKGIVASVMRNVNVYFVNFFCILLAHSC